MNQEQLMSLVRDAMKVIGSVATLFGATTAQVDQWTSIVLMVAGPILAFAGIIWSQYSNTDSSMVAQAAKLASVKAITVTDQKLATAAREADPTIKVDVRPQF
jgi:hypothetical protein